MFKNFIKFILKLVFSVYVSAVLSFLLLNVGLSNKYSLPDAFSPTKIYADIISGDFMFIVLTIGGVLLFFRYTNYKN